MNGIFELTFLADGVGRFVSSAVQLNNRVASVAVALSAAGSIAIERSLDSVNFSTVPGFMHIAQQAVCR